MNISTRQFMRPGFTHSVLEALDHASLSGNALTLEIRESCLLEDAEIVKAKLSLLSEAGIFIAVDDLGTGTCSLSLLATLPLSAIKIDAQFVQRAPNDARVAATTRTLIHLGREMGFITTGEGVETLAQQEFLLENDCSIMQGYLLGKPCSAEDARRIIQSKLIH